MVVLFLVLLPTSYMEFNNCTVNTPSDKTLRSAIWRNTTLFF